MKGATGATPFEIPFGSLPNGAAVPLCLTSRKALSSGRNLKCTSAEPMTDICIQAKEGRLGDYTMTDAEITERENLL